MSLTPIDTFENGINRALYLLDLYDLLHNQRQRRIRSDWADSFRDVMHWNQSDCLERVDGNNCILVLRNPTQWTMKHFEHEHLAELLRAAYAFAVSAMDRYFHDLILENLLLLLRRRTQDVPNALANFKVPLADVEAAVEHALRSRGAKGTATRPRITLKKRFANALHKCAFQGSREIDGAVQMLGVRSIWGKLGQRMSGSAEDIQGGLDTIVHRRNQIVHEGDVRRGSRADTVKCNAISSASTRKDILWLRKLVKTMDRVLQDEL